MQEGRAAAPALILAAARQGKRNEMARKGQRVAFP